jgi:hypothetical protein
VGPVVTDRLILAAALVALVNLPFGYWRVGARRLSASWFLAIHVPVLLVIGIRLLLDLPFSLRVLPFTVASFALGQWLGGRMRRSEAVASLLRGREPRE